MGQSPAGGSGVSEFPAGSRISCVLIADDQRDVLDALKLLLKGEPFAVETASSPAGVLSAVGKAAFDALLIDLNYTRDTTSGQEGIELLRAVRSLEPELPVIVMTAWGTIDVAVTAMREGASDFIEKPWDNQRLLSVLRNQVELGRALRTARRLQAEKELLQDHNGEFIAESPVMQALLQLVARVGTKEFEEQVRDLAMPVEFGLDTMNHFIDWQRNVPFQVIRGEGECAI